MKLIHNIAEMKNWTRRQREAGCTLGFVPTMGYLHEGHLSLVKQSLEKCDATVVSIFVNPKQFGPGEDLDTYPVDIEADRRCLEELGVDVLFMPNDREMYPPGFQTYVQVEGITRHLCGASRPGFFRGVSTVVLKLFNVVQPHLAFFGEKDRQQLAVVNTLVRDLNLDIQIVGVPIYREADGLAASSRNHYLNGRHRVSALCLNQALETARKLVESGESSAARIRQAMRTLIESHEGTQVDYISVCDPECFTELEEVRGEALIALAVQVGPARLIDNILIETRPCNESC